MRSSEYGPPASRRPPPAHTGETPVVHLTPASIIAALTMKPHPEGGHYVETFRDTPNAQGRAHATVIYFLLQRGERSHWHRVDASEMWFWHAGAPLKLGIDQHEVTLGPNILNGERAQAIVPAHAWQAAESLGDWTLVSCVVAPGFEFAGFELAAPDFTP